MFKTKENGITLVALVITIVVLLILLSLGINSGIPTLQSAHFTQFKNELKNCLRTVKSHRTAKRRWF